MSFLSIQMPKLAFNNLIIIKLADKRLSTGPNIPALALSLILNKFAFEDISIGHSIFTYSGNSTLIEFSIVTIAIAHI